ncbi:MAG: class I SAM-dependent methyltransferase [Myxococcaceae bacterium]
MTRIVGEKIELDPEDVHRFFERRGETINDAHPLTSILYQDENPALAEQRDAYEKERVLPLLGLRPEDRVLDLGCGIGRWADVLGGRVRAYHGVDFSASLVAAAKSRVRRDAFTFQQLAVEDASPEALPVPAGFTHVFIGGVLIYLNDDQVDRSLACAAACCGPSALIYLREPVACEARLTLKRFFSADLKTHYNAIYRTASELRELLDRRLSSAGFRWELEDSLYPEHLNNRRETRQSILILRRP